MGTSRLYIAPAPTLTEITVLQLMFPQAICTLPFELLSLHMTRSMMPLTVTERYGTLLVRWRWDRAGQTVAALWLGPVLKESPPFISAAEL